MVSSAEPPNLKLAPRSLSHRMNIPPRSSLSFDASPETKGIDEADLYPHDFFQSRRRFLQLANSRGAKVSSFPVATKTSSFPEPLTIDIAYIGDPAAHRKIIHIAGTHGVEGYLGSAIQCCIFNSLDVLPPDCGVALVHCLNPWGMAMVRRSNENNVDLNRNSVFPPLERVGLAEYGLVRDLLLPVKRPTVGRFTIAALRKVLKHGFRKVLQAITGGQYIDPEGLFYGGLELQQELQIFSTWLKSNINPDDHVICLDLHSGLGGFCKDALLLDDADGSDAHKRFITLFPDQDVQAPDSTDSINYITNGSLGYLIPHLFPHAVVDQAVHEFGTVSPGRVLYSLLEDNFLFFKDPSKRQVKKLLQCFCPEAPVWRRNGVRRGVEVFFRAVRGAGESSCK